MYLINFGGNFVKGETGNWIASIINWLVNGTNVGVGIMLFTLILQIIILPFTIYSKFSARKNSIKMEEMRPELERLQKQYANDKNLYNQKMMALYKKNGYSMLSACLPTLISLVIFIVAIDGFTFFSQYKNRETFYEMSNAYNNVVYAGFDLDNEYIKRNADGKLIVDDKYFIESNETEINLKNKDGEDFKVNISKRETGNGNKFFSLYTTNGYMKYARHYTVKDDGNIQLNGNPSFETIADTLTNNKLASKENNYLKYENKTFKETDFENEKDFLSGIQKIMSAESYKENKSSFLWVKNIWLSDTSFTHPISEDATAINQTGGSCSNCSCNKEGITFLTDEDYKIITERIEEKNSPNGFFILVILTAGMSLLMQFVTVKSQKAQMELQTVDGQGAQTQKMMMWMMPFMMAIFSFMYSAAFSIYIIFRYALDLGLTFLINYFVNRKYGKYAVASNNGEPKKEIIRGRVYVKKEEEKEEIKTKKDKNKEKDQTGDFLNSEKENKRIKKNK